MRPATALCLLPPFFSSPLAIVLSTMLGCLNNAALGKQATIFMPYILTCALSPVKVAGTLAQTLAEAIAGMAFVQLFLRGAPVVFGSFASSFSLQPGAPT